MASKKGPAAANRGPALVCRAAGGYLVRVTVPCMTVEWPGNEQKNT